MIQPAATNLNWITVPSGSLVTGTQDCLAGQINGIITGYDSLKSLQVMNLGTAAAGTDIYRLRLWYQAGGGGGGVTFNPQTAQRWGQFTPQDASTWDLTLSPAPEVLANSALYLTADISGNAASGRTIRLGLTHGSANFTYGNTLPAAGLFNLNSQTIVQAAGVQLSWSNPTSVNLLKGQTSAGVGGVRLQNLTSYAWLLKSLRLSMVDATGQAQNAGTVFDKLSLVYQNTTLATLNAPFAGDQWILTSPVTVPAPGEIQLDVVGDITPNPGVTNFKLSLPDGQCVNQGELLSAGVGGQAFPLLTTPLHVRAQELSAVFSAYPNPFKAGQGGTKIVYYLKSAGNVKLQVRTVSGELVKTLVDAEAPAGMQAAAWDGRNERGQRAISGAYLLVIDVKYADGSQQRLTRKLALVR